MRNMRTGNIMFCLAATLAYAKRNNLQFLVPVGESYELMQLYNAITRTGYMLLPTDRGRNEHVVYWNHVAGLDEIPSGYKNGALSGYFQNAALFEDYEDDVRRMFSCLMPDEHVKGELGIHIRLGDYTLYPDIYYTIDSEWLKRALDKCESFDYIRLYSDTPEQALEIVSKVYSGRVDVDDNEDPLACIKRMAASDQMIISASSMSWWAAWLGKQKNVVYPSPWLKKKWAMAHNTPLPTWTGLDVMHYESQH